MKRTLAIFLALFAVLIVGCGSNPPEQGIVREKSYDDPDDWTSQYCIVYQKVGQVQICTVWDTTEHHDGPHWSLYLEDRRNDRKGWVEVSQRDFQNHHIGDWYEVPR